MERLDHNLEKNQEMSRAISPQEVADIQREQMPHEFITVINRLLIEGAGVNGTRIRRDTLIKSLVESGLERSDIVTKPWFQFEDYYREAGWDVTYKYPTGDQDFESYYDFIPSKQRVRRNIGSAALNESINTDS